MKKVLLTFLAFVSVSTMFANITIPTEFDGIKLGYSSSEEVNKILTSRGLQFSIEDSDTVAPNVYEATYKGDYIYEEMCFDGVIARYTHGVLTCLNLVGHCDSACIDYAKSFVEKVHSKYDDLESADSTLFVMMATHGTEELSKWSRKDEESIILTMHNDSCCICSFIAQQRLIEISVNIAFEAVKQGLPDYAEENKVYGVGGVKFGDSRQSVKSVMLSKSTKLIEEDSHSIVFNDTKIGGVTYDYTTFYFSANQLVSVNLQDAFYSWRKEEALMQFENVKSQYERKYTNMTLLKDEDDLKAYSCGAYIDGYDYLPIIISFQKSLSKGGDIMYYVQVDYYVYRKDNLYDDEI